MEVEAYNGVDEAGGNCSSSLDMEAFVTTSSISKPCKKTRLNASRCMLNVTDNVTASGATFFNIKSMSRRSASAVAEYWNYFFGTLCGDKWLAEVMASTAPPPRW